MRYRLTSATGQVLDEGEGRVDLEGGAVVVSPTLGQPLRVRPADIVEVSEPAPYVLRLRLAEGPSLDLSQLGQLRTQLLAQIGDVRADDTVSALLMVGLGKPESFTGAVDEVEADIRLYDDALVAVPAAGVPIQIPYSFIDGVATDTSGYRISVDTGEGVPIDFHRLARRTTPFLDMLQQRVNQARGRTAAFLAALLPGLGSVALRAAASLLRDGLAARKTELDAVDATIWPALIQACTIPERASCAEAVARVGAPAIGFRQLTSVERGPVGGSAWEDPSVARNVDHGGGVPTIPGGVGGVMAANLLRQGPPQLQLGFDGPFQAHGSILALQMLGNPAALGGALGPSGGPPRQPTDRQDMSRDTLTPASTDHDALVVAGGEPTVLAFLLAESAAGSVIYEALNEGDRATYVYRPAPGGMRALNRALVLIGFRVESIYADAETAGSKYRHAVERLPYLRTLRDALAGRAIHTEGWERKLQSFI